MRKSPQKKDIIDIGIKYIIFYYLFIIGITKPMNQISCIMTTSWRH